MMRLCVPVADEATLEMAKASEAEGIVLARLELLGSLRGVRPLVAAVRCDLALPYAELPPPRSGLGVTILVSAPTPSPPDVRSLERVKDFRIACVRSLQALGEWAERSDAVVSVASGVDTFFEGSLELTEMLRAAQSPALRWTLNTCDAEACGEGVSGATDVGGDLLGHVVAEDWSGAPGDGGGLPGRCAPGGGQVPFARLFEQLDFLAYEGAVEVAGAPEEWAGALAVLRQARDA
jgi:sugar phosphate isomerase/epimerase